MWTLTIRSSIQIELENPLKSTLVDAHLNFLYAILPNYLAHI